MPRRKRGTFIVIEGTDGSGKSTQFKLLARALRRAGRRVKTIKFPQYGKPSAYLVEEYLNGAYGKATDVGPYKASLFYALDRFQASFQIKRWLEQGYVVLSDRYLLSNAAHQGGKLKGRAARAAYWSWLMNLEYEVLGIVRPNRTLVLHVPSALARRLMNKRGNRTYLKGKAKLDIHEADAKHIRATEAAYLELARRYRLPVIEGVERGRLLTPHEIHRRVLSKINQH